MRLFSDQLGKVCNSYFSVPASQLYRPNSCQVGRVIKYWLMKIYPCPGEKFQQKHQQSNAEKPQQSMNPSHHATCVMQTSQRQRIISPSFSRLHFATSALTSQSPIYLMGKKKEEEKQEREVQVQAKEAEEEEGKGEEKRKGRGKRKGSSPQISKIWSYDSCLFSLLLRLHLSLRLQCVLLLAIRYYCCYAMPCHGFVRNDIHTGKLDPELWTRIKLNS